MIGVVRSQFREEFIASSNELISFEHHWNSPKIMFLGLFLSDFVALGSIAIDPLVVDFIVVHVIFDLIAEGTPVISNHSV